MMKDCTELSGDLCGGGETRITFVTPPNVSAEHVIQVTCFKMPRQAIQRLLYPQ